MGCCCNGISSRLHHLEDCIAIKDILNVGTKQQRFELIICHARCFGRLRKKVHNEYPIVSMLGI